MSKRRLSKQQKSRIDQQQQQKREQLDTTDAQRDPLENGENLSAESPGLVISHYGQQLEIESLQDGDAGKLYRCYQRANLPALVTGDRVVWQADGDESGVVVALEERRNIFSRPNSKGTLRPIASNIDIVLIVVASLPVPFPNLIDRYLVAIENLGLLPVLILNKSDLPDQDSRESIDSISSLYTGLGYQTLPVSAHTGAGMDALTRLLDSRTAVFVGQSGVGKSSLINTLSAQELTEVGALSAARDKGTHTTTTARLFHLGDCNIIDSPGIRDFGLWHISPGQLFSGFIEFANFAQECKFRDCSHQQEPHCALQQAVCEGKVSQQRLDSYFHILSSLNA